jgi:hypothetical protein
MLQIDLHVLDDDDDVMMMTAWIEIWNGDVMIERVTMKHHYYYRGRRVEVVVVEMTSRCHCRRHGLYLFSSLWSG